MSFPRERESRAPGGREGRGSVVDRRKADQEAGQVSGVGRMLGRDGATLHRSIGEMYTKSRSCR